LNQPGDLTFAQIERISQTMPLIIDLWLSGGEPTLRRDVPEIINTFVENNKVRRVIVPTNGLVKSRAYEIVDGALERHPQIDLYLNIALDGYGARTMRLEAYTAIGKERSTAYGFFIR
jgi:molybdenum cofactor biosynthesis enzyme MoaA